jgi:hypothetical protein
MKKIPIFLMFFIVLSMASEKIDFKTYKFYVDSLVNYKLLSNYVTYNPFVKLSKRVAHIKTVDVKKSKQKNVEKTPKKDLEIKNQVSLLAVLNDKAYLKFLNTKKWLKEGETFNGVKLLKIVNVNAVLLNIVNKKKLIKIKDNQNFNIKVKGW